jgi:hypothetical protein
MNKEEVNPEVRESLRNQSNRTTKFICKVCGAGFEDGEVLDSHIAEAHHPKRTVTVKDIVSIVFDGTLNFPKTKSKRLKEIRISNLKLHLKLLIHYEICLIRDLMIRLI